ENRKSLREEFNKSPVCWLSPLSSGKGDPMNDTQTHFLAHCPHCSAGLRVRRTYRGQQVKCKQCDQVFVGEEGQDGGEGVRGGAGPPPLPVAQAERIVVSCPSCRSALSVREAYIGRQVRCKQCDEPFVISAPSAPRHPDLEPTRAPADDGREVLREELERLRGELEQSTAENRRLGAAHDQLQA